MKTLLLSLTVILGCASLSHARTPSAKLKELTGPRWVFESLETAFPKLKGPEIKVAELRCLATNNVYVSNDIGIEYECSAHDSSGKRSLAATEESTVQLLFALINGGAPIDRTSEPGTTYVNLKNLSCSQKSSAEFSCRYTE